MGGGRKIVSIFFTGTDQKVQNNIIFAIGNN